MIRRLQFFEEAAEEIEEAASWYGQRSDVARASFLSEIDSALDAILDAPSRWPSYVDSTRRYVCRTFPYTIVYFVEGVLVVVAAVAHEKRRPGYWRGRMR